LARAQRQILLNRRAGGAGGKMHSGEAT
jgi:hypothetical protein